MHMVLETKTAMERCIEAIEANNAKYPIPIWQHRIEATKQLTNVHHMMYGGRDEQYIREIKEQTDAWNY